MELFSSVKSRGFDRSPARTSASPLSTEWFKIDATNEPKIAGRVLKGSSAAQRSAASSAPVQFDSAKARFAIASSDSPRSGRKSLGLKALELLPTHSICAIAFSVGSLRGEDLALEPADPHQRPRRSGPDDFVVRAGLGRLQGAGLQL